MSTLGNYRLIATLGRGGMAEVFLAVRHGHGGFTKLVVIKRLRPDLIELGDAARYRSLILDEARLAARLHHPNIVQTFEVHEDDGAPYLAMEYLDGQPLSQVISAANRARTRLPAELALRIVSDTLAALDHAHELRDYGGAPLEVVHRDVSPQNLFWTYDGDIKLMDFGVAKFALGSSRTDAGMIKGKLTYMAPEQARGQAIDRRADLFAVGIILWELIAGRRLLRADSDAASLQKLLFEPLPPLEMVRPEVDPAIAAICARALERDPALRYPTAAAMRADLERVRGARNPRREDLAAFVAPLFVTERKDMALLLDRAMSGRDDAPLLALRRPEVSTSREAFVDPDREPTLPERAPIATAPATTEKPRSPRRWRAWAIGGALAAAAVAVAIAWPRAQGASALAAGVPATSAPSTMPTMPAPPTAPPPALRLCGSNTIGAELAPALVEAFLRRKGATDVARHAGDEPEAVRLTATLSTGAIDIDVRAKGSATAFDGLEAGTCDIGLASRAINDAEVARLDKAGNGDLRRPATEHVIALDGIAVIVHPDNPLTTLDRTALHDVFTGAITDWAQLGGTPGPIAILARDDKSGTYDTFKHLVLGKEPLVKGARRFADSNALADAVAGDPQAIGFIGLAYIRSARALAIGDRGTPPMLPTSFTVTTEGYLLARRLYAYTTPRPRTPLATELVGFALSPAGQDIVAKTGFVDLSVGLIDPPPCDARCPRRYATLIRDGKRLSLDFRFRPGSNVLDSRGARDLDRVIQFLHGHPTARLSLFGFSDSNGAPAANLTLSQQRAATVARELETRGVHPALVEGYGAARPVAANTDDTGRERNRRVEVWLAE